MGSFSIWHWLIVLAVVLLLFGTGKVSNLMGEFGKGIKTFKKNVSEDDTAPARDASLRDANLRDASMAEPVIPPSRLPPVAEPVRQTTPVNNA